MSETISGLVHLYERAADLSLSDEDFALRLAEVDGLDKAALLELARLLGLVLPRRISTELLRIRIRERIRNRRGMAQRCLMLQKV